MPVLVGAALVYPCAPDRPDGSLSDAVVAWRDGVITWVGALKDLPPELDDGARLDARGGIVIPGLVECHTHLMFGGWRTGDYLKRVAGEGYASSHEGSGGIHETVRRTAEESDAALVARAVGFAREMTRLGVTRLEVKSGYGLTVERERRLLELYGIAAREVGIPMEVTFLAHMIPPEFRDDRERFVTMLCDFVDEVADRRLAGAVDVFVESIAFTPGEARRILGRAADRGLARKAHVDQLADGGGAALAAEMGAFSADHLEHTSRAGMDALASAGVVGVVLPFAAWYLRQPFPDGRALVDRGVRVAVSTDFNPGSAPALSLPLAMSFAVMHCGLTPMEALRGVTVHAAAALGLGETVGSISPGMRADLVVLDADSVEQWVYFIRPSATRLVVAGGAVVFEEFR